MLAREEKQEDPKKSEKKKSLRWRTKSFGPPEVKQKKKFLWKSRILTKFFHNIHFEKIAEVLQTTPHSNWLRVKVLYTLDDNEIDLVSLVNPEWTVEEWKNKLLKKLPMIPEKELYLWHPS